MKMICRETGGASYLDWMCGDLSRRSIAINQAVSLGWMGSPNIPWPQLLHLCKGGGEIVENPQIHPFETTSILF